ncbi:MAG TPA: DUF1579 domain-containing protein [Planctomycetes bacterium]|nr:DUF1579 domain-containing protein [Planctomycetota bacterium]
MNHRRFAFPTLFAVLLSACQSTTPSSPPAGDGAEPDMQDMMAMMEKLATPGPEHAFLDDLAGTFDATITLWLDPSAPPVVSTGTMESHWILGGRYLQGDYSSMFMGAPFSGLSLTGYDNAQGVFQGTWLDTMGTGMMPISAGHRTGNTITFERDMFDPMQGKMVHEREVITIEDHDHNSMLMFVVQPDGTAVQTMEIEYTRKK